MAAQTHFAAFREATGMGIRLVRAGSKDAGRPLVSADNPFCGLVTEKNGEVNSCCTRRQSTAGLASRRAPLVERCLAGLVHVIAPVVRDGLHVATLEGGQVLPHRPTEADFQSVLQRFPGRREGEDLAKLRTAYFQTPVLSGEQFQAAVNLFWFMAESLSVGLLQQLSARAAPRASHMERARAFIEENLGEPISMRHVARHLNLCQAYFCRLFKKESGRTFGNYLARVRVHRAQSLLRCSSKPITEIGYAAGFQSIWHFNHVFKRLTGLTPMQYRKRPAAAKTRA